MNYTDNHEWVKIENDHPFASIGISTFGQRQLGEIVFVEFPEIGKQVKVGDQIAVLESTKAAVDVYSPISGTIVAINEDLKNQIDLINTSPEEEGWLVKIQYHNADEISHLYTQTNS